MRNDGIRAYWRQYRPNAPIRTSYLLRQAERIMTAEYQTPLHLRVAAAVYASAYYRTTRGGRLPLMLPAYRGGTV